MPSPDRQEEFANQLDESADDPFALSALFKAWLGNAARDLEVSRLSLRNETTREAILGLGRVITFFARHGTMEPEQLGVWLDAPHRDLWYGDEKQRPVDVLWKDLTGHSEIPNGIGRVVTVAKTQALIQSTPEAEVAARQLPKG